MFTCKLVSPLWLFCLAYLYPQINASLFCKILNHGPLSENNRRKRVKCAHLKNIAVRCSKQWLLSPEEEQIKEFYCFITEGEGAYV